MRIAFAALRLGALIGALALAACAQSTSDAQLAPAAAPPAQPAAPVAAAPPPDEPLTTEKARGQCWMKFENDRKAKDLDTRARLVEQCVAERMSGRSK